MSGRRPITRWAASAAEGRPEKAVITRSSTCSPSGFSRDQLAGGWGPGTLQARRLRPGPCRTSSQARVRARLDGRPCRPPATVASGSGRGGDRAGGAGPPVPPRQPLRRLPRPRHAPCHRPDGTISGFIGRASEHAPADVPKYLNSPRTCLYDKSACCRPIRSPGPLAAGARPVIAEGPSTPSPSPPRARDASQAFHHAVPPSPAGTDRPHPRAPTCVLLACSSPSTTIRPAARRDPCLPPALPACRQHGHRVIQPGQDPARLHAVTGPAGPFRPLANHTYPLADVVTDSELQQWEPWLKYAKARSMPCAHGPDHRSHAHCHVSRQVARLAIRLGMTHATVTKAVTDALTQRDTPGRHRLGAARQDSSLSVRSGPGSRVGSGTEQHPRRGIAESVRAWWATETKEEERSRHSPEVHDHRAQPSRRRSAPPIRSPPRRTSADPWTLRSPPTRRRSGSRRRQHHQHEDPTEHTVVG